MSGKGILPSAATRRRLHQPHRRVMRSITRARVADPHAKVAVAEHVEDEPHKHTFLEACWPTVFGLMLAMFVEHLRQKVNRDFGVVGDRLIFPWAEIFDRPDLGLGDPDLLSKFVLQIQFPLTGLYATWNLMRGHKLITTAVQIAFVYLLAAFVLWLLSAPGASHGL